MDRFGDRVAIAGALAVAAAATFALAPLSRAVPGAAQEEPPGGPRAHPGRA